jgi:hypothetical protein
VLALVTTVGWVVACATSPVFAGVAARDPAGDAAAERAAVSLAQALERRGVTDLGTPPLPVMADETDTILENAVLAATSRYQEGDFPKAVEKADDAIERFETKLAFGPKGPWGSYAQALVIKALAQKKLGKEAEVDGPFTKMAVTMPNAVPDPSLAPPKLLERHTQILAALRSKPRVALEITSTPPGAEVVVDGEPRGVTPVTVRDLLPGTHYVSLAADGMRVDKRVEVGDAGAKLDERVGDPRTNAAKALRAAVAARADEATLVARAKDVGDDVLVGVLVDGALVVARVHEGALLVAGTKLDDKAPLKARVTPLGEALLDGVAPPEGVWLPASEGSPRDVLFATAPVVVAQDPVVTDATEGEEGAPVALIALGVGAGVLVLGGAVAGVVAAVLLSQDANKVEVVVDASAL